jgi:hypothetical protein
MNDEYIKLIHFKIYGYNCKNDERLEVVNKIFPFLYYWADVNHVTVLNNP